MFRSLADWRTYLEGLNPDRIELGLERVRKVFSKLNFVPEGKIIVVAGTNGKGSSVAALEAMLTAAGQSVGSYTSPHLIHFNERIRYNAIPLSDQDLIETFTEIESLREEIPLTYFEFMTLAGICALSKKTPDYFVFEVGLGGRLDAVNVIDADVSIVTGIALDHMDWLGQDIESIGFEKAGIYRAGKPAVFASLDCPSSVKKRVNDISAIPYFSGEQISIEKNALGLPSYQIQYKNQIRQFDLLTTLPEPSVLAALTALVLLDFDINEHCLNAVERVSVAGRHQTLQIRNTSCLLDVAHNPQAVSYLADCLMKSFDYSSCAVVVGLMTDKVLDEVFQPMLAIAKQWLIVKPDVIRAASVDDQRQCLINLGVDSKNITNVGSIEALSKYLPYYDRLVIYGSFYTVGEFLSIFGDEESE